MEKKYTRVCTSVDEKLMETVDIWRITTGKCTRSAFIEQAIRERMEKLQSSAAKSKDVVA